MSRKNDENQLNLAIQALKNDPKLKVYTVSKIYNKINLKEREEGFLRLSKLLFSSIGILVQLKSNNVSA